MNFEKKNQLFSFQFIQKLIEKHQRYLSDIDSDSESDNEIQYHNIDSRKQLPIQKNDYQNKLETDEKKSFKKENYGFPNASNFDDTGLFFISYMQIQQILSLKNYYFI